MTRSRSSAHPTLGQPRGPLPAVFVPFATTNQTRWHTSGSTATRARSWAALIPSQRTRAISLAWMGRGVRRRGAIYPVGLKADRSAVRPINLWGSMVAVCVFDGGQCQKKCKLKGEGRQARKSPRRNCRRRERMSRLQLRHEVCWGIALEPRFPSLRRKKVTPPSQARQAQRSPSVQPFG
jgi:hypothetical protein